MQQLNIDDIALKEEMSERINIETPPGIPGPKNIERLSKINGEDGIRMVQMIRQLYTRPERSLRGCKK